VSQGAESGAGEFDWRGRVCRDAHGKARIARESRTPVFLFGPSQVGKSWGLIHDAESHDDGRTIYVRCSSISGLHGLMNAIGKCIGVSPAGNKDAMKQSMIAAFQSDMLLILDEFHELLYVYRRESFFACAEFVRELYDRVGMGIVLSLTNFGRDRIWESRRSDLEQIFRRGVHRVQVGTKGAAAQDDMNDSTPPRLDFPPRTLTCRIPDATGNAEWSREVLHHSLATGFARHRALALRERYASSR
jgi:hypothetical protein